MNTTQLIDHYGTVSNAAKALGVTVPAVYQWINAGVIPPLRQSDIEVKTQYALLSDYTIRKKKMAVK